MNRPDGHDRAKAVTQNKWVIVKRGAWWWAITPLGLPLPTSSWRVAVQRAAWKRPAWSHQSQIF